VDSEKELVMDYEFTRSRHYRDDPYWLYSADRRTAVGLVERRGSEWRVVEWRPSKDVLEYLVATLPGNMPVDEVLSAAKTILLRLKQ